MEQEGRLLEWKKPEKRQEGPQREKPLQRDVEQILQHPEDTRAEVWIDTKKQQTLGKWEKGAFCTKLPSTKISVLWKQLSKGEKFVTSAAFPEKPQSRPFVMSQGELTCGMSMQRFFFFSKSLKLSNRRSEGRTTPIADTTGKVKIPAKGIFL